MSDERELLTVEEKRAIDLAGNLWASLCGIVGHGPTRDADLAELVVHVHALQSAILSQAARRAYPDEYRLLGESRGAGTPVSAGFIWGGKVLRTGVGGVLTAVDGPDVVIDAGGVRRAPKPLRCRLGFHRWRSDGDEDDPDFRCTRCGGYLPRCSNCGRAHDPSRSGVCTVTESTWRRTDGR